MIKNHFKKVDKIKRKSYYSELFLQFVKALLLAAIMVSVWQWLHPFQETSSLFLSLLCFLITIIWKFPKRPASIKVKDAILGLETKYKNSVYPPLDCDEELKSELSINKDTFPLNEAAKSEWSELLARELNLIQRMEKARIQMRATSLVIPFLIAFSTMHFTHPSVASTYLQVQGLVRNFIKGSSLEILSGEYKADQPRSFNLGRTTHQIELVEDNLIKIFLDGKNESEMPIVKLVKPGGLPPDNEQTFLAAPSRNKDSGQIEPGLFELTFSSPSTSDLYVPSLFGNQKLVHFNVKTSPVPKVTLSLAQEQPKDPWHDDISLPLIIKVEATNPLKTVKIRIITAQKEYSEMVANFLKNDQLSYVGSYPVELKSFVDSDIADIELVAVAEDLGVPKNLTGESKPLKIKVASGYGRYQIALQKLRAVKHTLDEALNSQNFKLNPEVQASFSDALKTSESSPYFDGLDRLNLTKMGEDLNRAGEYKKIEDLMIVNSKLNDFLFEHEMLDDRERDRDFFVAVRALSRVIELEATKRPVKVSYVGGRLLTFLDTRNERWKKRLARLSADQQPENANQIVTKQPFHKSIQIAVDLAEKSGEANSENNTNSAMQTLATTVEQYRHWIDSLEKAEDTARQEMESERQKAIANAENKLKELQQAQGEISSRLDKSDSRQDQVSSEWTQTAKNQVQNQNKTKGLVPEMASMSPEGAKRLDAAAQAMGEALGAGGAKKFSEAESMADLAGRLLNESKRALSEQKQQDRGREPRKRAQTSGDKYFGNSVGGELEMKREYSVDRKYREEILRSVEENPTAKEDLPLLNNYLRKTVR